MDLLVDVQLLITILGDGAGSTIGPFILDFTLEPIKRAWLIAISLTNVRLKVLIMRC